MAARKCAQGDSVVGRHMARAGTLLVTNFDMHAFHGELLEKRSDNATLKSDRSIGCTDLQRERLDGIRLILETRGRLERRELWSSVREAISPVDDFKLEPLFFGADREPSPPEVTDLACFWLLSVGGISFFETSHNPFDFAYHLLDRLDLESVEPDIPYVGFECFAQNRPVSSGVKDRAWHLRRMNAKRAWDYSGQRGAGIWIGHPDTGYAEHIDLDPARVRRHLGFDFVEMKPDPLDALEPADGFAHGTATGSVIMSGGTIVSPPAEGEGGTGAPGTVTGLVPEAELVPVRAARSVRHIHGGRLAQAIYHCRKRGCSVISIGMGGHPSRALFHAMQDAIRHDVIVVAAAGNRVGLCDRAVWPARYTDCVGLAASDERDEPWQDTSRGPGVDVAAPGAGVWRAIREQQDSGQFQAGPADGTSYAAANAAGAAALWLGHHGHEKLVRIARSKQTTVQALFQQSLKGSARRPEDWDGAQFGAGIVDLYRLLRIRPRPGEAPTAPCILNEYRDNLRSLFGPVETTLADDGLDTMFRVPPGADPLARWGHELATIAARLEMTGNSVLAKLRSDSTLSALDRARLLVTVIRPLASEGLDLDLAELPAPH